MVWRIRNQRVTLSFALYTTLIAIMGLSLPAVGAEKGNQKALNTLEDSGFGDQLAKAVCSEQVFMRAPLAPESIQSLGEEALVGNRLKAFEWSTSLLFLSGLWKDPLLGAIGFLFEDSDFPLLTPGVFSLLGSKWEPQIKQSKEVKDALEHEKKKTAQRACLTLTQPEVRNKFYSSTPPFYFELNLMKARQSNGKKKEVLFVLHDQGGRFGRNLTSHVVAGWIEPNEVSMIRFSEFDLQRTQGWYDGAIKSIFLSKAGYPLGFFYLGESSPKQQGGDLGAEIVAKQVAIYLEKMEAKTFLAQEQNKNKKAKGSPQFHDPEKWFSFYKNLFLAYSKFSDGPQFSSYGKNRRPPAQLPESKVKQLSEVSVKGLALHYQPFDRDARLQGMYEEFCSKIGVFP